MVSKDPNPQGGSLSDMAVECTKVSNDAGTQRNIPSVPRPGQITDPTNDPNNLGAADLAGAADNAQDISRVNTSTKQPLILLVLKLILRQTTRDNAPTPDVITGIGDAVPSEVDSRRLHNVVNQDISKGHGRMDKHVAQKGSDQEKGASEGAQEGEVIAGVIGGS